MEEAANELINMLMDFDHSQREDVESYAESKPIDHNESEGMLIFSLGLRRRAYAVISNEERGLKSNRMSEQINEDYKGTTDRAAVCFNSDDFPETSLNIMYKTIRNP